MVLEKADPESELQLCAENSSFFCYLDGVLFETQVFSFRCLALLLVVLISAVMQTVSKRKITF